MTLLFSRVASDAAKWERGSPYRAAPAASANTPGTFLVISSSLNFTRSSPMTFFSTGVSSQSIPGILGVDRRCQLASVPVPA